MHHATFADGPAALLALHRGSPSVFVTHRPENCVAKRQTAIDHPQTRRVDGSRITRRHRWTSDASSVSTRYGLVGPAGLPPELIRRISDDVRDTIRTPGFFDRNLSLKGWTLVASSPADLSSAVRQQAPIVAEMVKAAGITPQ